jgi:hypothetical protein
MRVLFTIAVLTLAACGGRPQIGVDTTATTGMASRTLADDPSAIIDAGRGMVLGVHVGMTVDSVKLLLGEPVREGSELNDSTPVAVLEYSMGTVKGDSAAGVTDFLCGGDQCATAEGVGIGDSTDVLLGTYGPTPPRGPEESPEALDYRLGTTSCNLTFTLSTGRVTSIELSCAH